MSLSLSLMSELKISFLINCWKHQADVNSSSNVGSFIPPRQLNLQIMLALLKHCLPSCWTGKPPFLLLFSTSRPAAMMSCPIREGSMVTTTQARSLPWGENDSCLVSKLGLISAISGYLYHHHHLPIPVYVPPVLFANIHSNECERNNGNLFYYL